MIKDFIFLLGISACIIALAFKYYYVYQLEKKKGRMRGFGFLSLCVYLALPYFNVDRNPKFDPIIKKINATTIAFYIIFLITLVLGIVAMGNDDYQEFK